MYVVAYRNPVDVFSLKSYFCQYSSCRWGRYYFLWHLLYVNLHYVAPTNKENLSTYFNWDHSIICMLLWNKWMFLSHLKLTILMKDLWKLQSHTQKDFHANLQVWVPKFKHPQKGNILLFIVIFPITSCFFLSNQCKFCFQVRKHCKPP